MGTKKEGKIEALTLEKTLNMGEIILSWLKEEPLSFADDDWLYVRVKNNHLEIGKITYEKLE